MERIITHISGARNKFARLVLPPQDNPLTTIRETLDNLSGLDGDQGFFETVAAAARKSGCEFLFEVPGALFAIPDARAAAIRSNNEAPNNDFFILYDQKNGVIRILSGSEVPTEVSRFVSSYVAVLQCLQEPGKSRRIH